MFILHLYESYFQRFENYSLTGYLWRVLLSLNWVPKFRDKGKFVLSDTMQPVVTHYVIQGSGNSKGFFSHFAQDFMGNFQKEQDYDSSIMFESLQIYKKTFLCPNSRDNNNKTLCVINLGH